MSALIGVAMLATQPAAVSPLALSFPQDGAREPALEKALLKAAAALRERAGLVAALAPAIVSERFDTALLDPAHSFGAVPGRFAIAPAPAKAAPPDEIASVPPVLQAPTPPVATPPVVPPAAPAPSVVASATPETTDVDTDIPMPARRPAELRLPAPAAGPLPPPVRRLAQGSAAQAPAPQAPAAAPAQPGFFEKLFGGASKPTGTALAYAAPDDGGLFGGIPRALSGRASYDRWTAVYDISAHTVYLPDGTRLEAHSGIGYMQDNPRYVTEHMRGATPPAVYELTLREAMFHGVQALRLTPVEGADTYGRGGLLAHTFMLGPNGYSNGCVVFRNYNAFLAAYMHGDIKHLAVVPHLS